LSVTHAFDGEVIGENEIDDSTSRLEKSTREGHDFIEAHSLAFGRSGNKG